MYNRVSCINENENFAAFVRFILPQWDIWRKVLYGYSSCKHEVKPSHNLWVNEDIGNANNTSDDRTRLEITANWARQAEKEVWWYFERTGGKVSKKKRQKYKTDELHSFLLIRSTQYTDVQRKDLSFRDQHATLENFPMDLAGKERDITRDQRRKRERSPAKRTNRSFVIEWTSRFLFSLNNVPKNRVYFAR